VGAGALARGMTRTMSSGPKSTNPAVTAFCALLAVSGCEKSGADREQSQTPTGVAATQNSLAASSEAKECCMGKNPCKGQGGCAVPESHACAGKNECAGRGGCSAHCPDQGAMPN